MLCLCNVFLTLCSLLEEVVYGYWERDLDLGGFYSGRKEIPWDFVGSSGLRERKDLKWD